MDQGLWQTIISVDFLHSSCMSIQTVLSCGKHCKTMPTGTVSRLWLRGWSWGFEIHFWRNIVHFWKSYICSNWMCKKETSVSHSSTESEINSLDAGLRLDGKPALDLWDLIVAVLHGNTNQSNQERWDLLMNRREVRSIPYTIQKRKKSRGMINDLDNVDFISSNVQSSRQQALLYVFEDNEAVIKSITKGRRPTIRHVSRTHRVAIDWLFDRINLDTKIPNQINCHQKLADILTKGNFTRAEWKHLLCLFNISHFSSTDCSEVMSKRMQKRFRWRKSLSKIEADDELVWRCSERTIDVLDMKVNNLWAHGMSSIIERTLTHQITQSGMLIKLGLLKSGNLMKWSKIEQDDLFYSHSTLRNVV